VPYAYFVLGMLSVLPIHMWPSDLAIVTVVGLIMGWPTAKAAASMAATGKWIWIVPVPFLAYSFIHDWFWPCKFCPSAKAAYFYPSADLQLFTAPALTLAGYSIGAWIASRARVRSRPPALL